MQNITVRELLDELNNEFGEYQLRVRRGEALNAVVLRAGEARIFRTCNSAEDLASILVEAVSNFANEVNDRADRIEEARVALQNFLNGDSEEIVIETEQTVVETLERELAALRRSLNAQRAVASRLRNQLQA